MAAVLQSRTHKALFLCLILLLAAASSSCLSQKDKERSSPECAFCSSKVLSSQTFYEDDLVVALCTHKPLHPGHCLIVPKRHIERFEELTPEEMDRIFQVIKKVHQKATNLFHTSSYLILQKNGKEAGQTVPHVHFHYIPRSPGDGSALKFLFQMYFINLLGPISHEQMAKNVAQFTQSLESA